MSQDNLEDNSLKRPHLADLAILRQKMVLLQRDIFKVESWT